MLRKTIIAGFGLLPCFCDVEREKGGKQKRRKWPLCLQINRAGVKVTPWLLGL